jgi:hypothetical protein
MVLITITQAGTVSEKTIKKKKKILVSIDRLEGFVIERINIEKKFILFINI